MVTVDTPDFIVSNEGSIWVFYPQSEEAIEACEDGTIQIEDWQRLGEGFGVDHRCAEYLIEAMSNDGFVFVEE
jgi:hypothetical protein